MTTVFLICAAIGGTILVLQFILAMVGLGTDALDLHLPHDVGADLHTDTDFHIDAHGHTDVHHVDSTWLFSVISFRTVVAAVAFFGLAGLTADASGLPTLLTLAIAIAAGLAAMFIVYWIMRTLMSLRSEGTANIAHAVGQTGTVYTTIPGEGAGTGKIQMNLQGRTMEYLAVTTGKTLAPGAQVVVSAVVASDTLEVESALEDSDGDAVSTP